MKLPYSLSSFKFNIKNILLYPLIGLLILSAAEYLIIRSGKIVESLPKGGFNSQIDRVYLALANDSLNIDWNVFYPDLEYINRQYDVSDFRVATLIRIMKDYPDKVPQDIMEKSKQTLLGFRYWMDEPGENGMCYWSENHQILFASAEYIAGQMYPDAVFTNSGLTGRQHMAKSRKRILDWLEMRWKFGFSEFYSNVYYNEDIAALINIIDYSNDTLLVNKSKIITDLLLYDIASQKSGNMFVSVSGRLYERHRKGGPRLSSRKIIDFVWSNKLPETPHLNYAFIASKKYSAPGVLVEIGRDTADAVIKQCNGLNIYQLKKEGYYGSDERSIMMQWGMEAFINPEIVNNSLEYIRKNNLFSNEFLADFRYYNFTILKLTGLEAAVTRILNPQETGTAILQANTYTYRTKNYSLYSVQNYSPGNYSCQEHVSGMNIDSSFSVFHSHPALLNNSEKFSPGYWVGYGRLPHVAQDSSVSLSIYSIPEFKNITEKALPDFTHAYFPSKEFDSVEICGNYIFGEKGNTYCALIGLNKFSFANNLMDDLIQKGKKVFWIIEAGEKQTEGSFSNFKKRILANKIHFEPNNLLLKYYSRNKEFALKYKEDFSVNGKRVNTLYRRFDSPYIKAGYKPDEMFFSFKGHYLKLNFDKGERFFN